MEEKGRKKGRGQEEGGKGEVSSITVTGMVVFCMYACTWLHTE